MGHTIAGPLGGLSPISGIFHAAYITGYIPSVGPPNLEIEAKQNMLQRNRGIGYEETSRQEAYPNLHRSHPPLLGIDRVKPIYSERPSIWGF